jgi:hypothetical protein
MHNRRKQMISVMAVCVSCQKALCQELFVWFLPTDLPFMKMVNKDLQGSSIV